METETRDTASTLLAYAVARASTNDDAPWWRFLLGQLRASRIDPACPPEAWERALADLTAGLDHVVATGRVPEDMGTAEQVVGMMSRAVLVQGVHRVLPAVHPRVRRHRAARARAVQVASQHAALLRDRVP
jgi:hypothetical protein